jgi:hypothetical protein
VTDAKLARGLVRQAARAIDREADTLDSAYGECLGPLIETIKSRRLAPGEPRRRIAQLAERFGAAPGTIWCRTRSGRFERMEFLGIRSASGEGAAPTESFALDALSVAMDRRRMSAQEGALGVLVSRHAAERYLTREPGASVDGFVAGIEPLVHWSQPELADMRGGRGRADVAAPLGGGLMLGTADLWPAAAVRRIQWKATRDYAEISEPPPHNAAGRGRVVVFHWKTYVGEEQLSADQERLRDALGRFDEASRATMEALSRLRIHSWSGDGADPEEQEEQSRALRGGIAAAWDLPGWRTRADEARLARVRRRREDAPGAPEAAPPGPRA